MKDRKIFADTNILVYSQRNDDTVKRDIALKLIDDYYITISTQSLNELCSVLLRKYKVEPNEIFKIIYMLSELSNEIFIVNRLTILSAVKIHEIYKYSYYDSLIIASALECNCNYLLSEDMNDGQIIENKLKIINPFEHFDEINNIFK